MVAVAQLVRAPDCGSGGCGFNSRQSPCGTDGLGAAYHLPDVGLRPGVRGFVFRSVAQLVEHWSPKPAVGGSSPSRPVSSAVSNQQLLVAVSSRGPGHSPLKAGTRVRIPLPLWKTCEIGGARSRWFSI